MTILSFETSCDETGIAVLKAEGGINSPDFQIEEDVVLSQIDIHRPWGGVVPNLAKREHDTNLPVLFKGVLRLPHLKNTSPDLIAVTVGPGLSPCLWSGINFAKEIQSENFSQSNLVGVNHLEGHLYSFLLAQRTTNADFENINDLFPAVHLLVSGGHTMIILMRSMTELEVLGETQDDAAGEAFDKVARMLNLPYPGGPEVSRLAEQGNCEAVDFPRPMINSGDYNFSFSGLKTAVLYYLKDKKDFSSTVFSGDDKSPRWDKGFAADVSASFQKAVIDTLTAKTIKAAKEFNTQSVMMSGGVASNSNLKKSFKYKLGKIGIPFITPPPRYNTDNGVVIGVAAYINHLAGKKYELEARPNLELL